jgi:hypothetical protein
MMYQASRLHQQPCNVALQAAACTLVSSHHSLSFGPCNVQTLLPVPLKRRVLGTLTESASIAETANATFT